MNLYQGITCLKQPLFVLHLFIHSSVDILSSAHPHLHEKIFIFEPIFVKFNRYVINNIYKLFCKFKKGTVQIVCIGTDRSQQTVQTKKQSDQGLHCLPFHQHLLNALMQCYIKLFLFLGQLWQLFEVSQILEFLWYLL